MRKGLTAAVAVLTATTTLMADISRFSPAPAPAQAQRWEDNAGQWRAIDCNSWEYREAFCRADGIREARLEQVYGGNCVQGQSWGYDNRGIWVREGCRARFSVVTGQWADGDRRGGDKGRGWGWGRDRNRDRDRDWDDRGGNWQTRDIDCQSWNWRYAQCRFDRVRDVRIVQRYAGECEQGRTWGWDRNGIWVDNGCRARFQVNYTGSYYGDSGGGRDYGYDRDRDDGRRDNNTGAIVAVVAGVALLAWLMSSANRSRGQRGFQTSMSAPENPNWAAQYGNEQASLGACLTAAQSRENEVFFNQLSRIEREGDQVRVRGALTNGNAFQCVTDAGRVTQFRLG
jgi:hypothetical protein